VLHAIDTPDRDLGLVAELLARLEAQQFTSPRLVALHEALMTAGVPPSRRIARLRSLVSWLDSTHNLLFAPIAYALLLRPQLAIAVARWHAAYGPAIAEWLRAIGEAEAFTAFATYAYERPRDPFPEIAGEAAMFEADALAHPLLPEATAVRNDVTLGGDGRRLIVLSGSNMSGKSTFLRTIGVNVVLALAGAPVAARRVRLSPLVLGATLHVEDSLQAGHSRFYAEILRIRTIVDAARGPVPLLFLLDEILHGTNSYDRRIGAEGIVRALVGFGAIGLITTHDLALAELPATLGATAVNMHFEDRLENGRMTFDYRLRPGVVEHSNALALMRAVGLDV
jgi:DNA mismatch repair ATPase MutS